MSLIQSFALKAQRQRGNALIPMIQEAIRAPGNYNFGELLELPAVQQLASIPELNPWLQLLTIFAYGTFADYRAHQSTLPKLSVEEISKLKQLSLISIAASENRVMSYDNLVKELEMGDIRQLEDLIIDAISNGLLQAKLDQQSRLVEVLSVNGRDLRPGDLDQMITKLQDWVTESEQVLVTLKGIEEQSAARFACALKHKADVDAQIQATKLLAHKELAEQQATAAAGVMLGGGGGGGRNTSLRGRSFHTNDGYDDDYVSPYGNSGGASMTSASSTSSHPTAWLASHQNAGSNVSSSKRRQVNAAAVSSSTSSAASSIATSASTSSSQIPTPSQSTAHSEIPK